MSISYLGASEDIRDSRTVVILRVPSICPGRCDVRNRMGEWIVHFVAQSSRATTDNEPQCIPSLRLLPKITSSSQHKVPVTSDE
jgi:hypothetical protein